MPETPTGRSGGVSNTGTINTGGGSVVGRDMTINTTTSTRSKMQIAFQPIADAVDEAPPAMRPAANATLEGLKQEVEKAEKGDSRMLATAKDADKRAKATPTLYPL